MKKTLSFALALCAGMLAAGELRIDLDSMKSGVNLEIKKTSPSNFIVIDSPWYKEKQKQYVEDYAKNNSMEYADVIESTYKMTEDEFNEELDSAAQTNAKEQMIVYYIARQEGLEVTDSEYKDFVAAQLESIGYTAKEFEDYTGSSYEEYVGGEEYIKYYMLYQKVIDMVVENAKGVDKLSTGK